MKLPLRILVSISLILVGSNGISQVRFQKIYGGFTGDFQGMDLIQNSDGGHLLAGFTTYYGQGNRDGYLIRIDSVGEILWSRAYGDLDANWFTNIESTIDGNFLICGTTGGSLNPSERDFLVMKIDLNGDTLWTNSYGGLFDEEANLILETLDNGFIIGGYSNSYSAGGSDIYIIKIDATGNMQWTKSYGGPGTDRLSAIIKSPTTGYYMSGSTSSFGQGDLDIWLLRISSIGDTLWTKTYGTTFPEFASNLIQIDNENLLLYGTCNGPVNVYDLMVIQVDTNGNQIWSRSYGGVNDELSGNMQKAANDGYFLGGVTYGFGAPDRDYHLVKIDINGDTIWTNSFRYEDYNYPLSFQANSDNTISILGRTGYFGGTGAYIYMVKTDTMGMTGCNEKSTPITIGSPNMIEGFGAIVGSGGNEYPLAYTVESTLTIDSSICFECSIDVSITAPSISCSNDTITLYGQGANSFNWSTGAVGDSLEIVLNSDTTIYVTGTSGLCNGTDSVSIMVLPNQQSNLTSTICDNDSILLEGSYQNSPGFYNDTLSSITGCDSVISTELIVNTTYESGLTMNICDGDSVYLNNSYVYQSGTYIDSLFTINGCDSILTIALNVSLSNGINLDTAICAGDSIFLGGAYQFINGNYWDTLFTTNGCDSVVISTNLELKETRQPTIVGIEKICVGDSTLLSVDGMYSTYLWSPEISSVNAIIISPILPAFYTLSVAVSDSTLCPEKSDSHTINVLDCKPEIFVPNVFSPNNDGINDYLEIYSKNVDNFLLEIFNRWGQLVYSTTSISDRWNGTHNDKKFNDAVFVYRLYISGLNGEFAIQHGNLSIMR